MQKLFFLILTLINISLNDKKTHNIEHFNFITTQLVYAQNEKKKCQNHGLKIIARGKQKKKLE